MILLHIIVEIKEMVAGGATFEILYSLLPKEIIIEWGLESYIACFFHKCGCPNHHKLQDEQHHKVPHLGRAWCFREDNTIGWHKDLILGVATWWWSTTDVLWLVGPTVSQPLLKWGYFSSHYWRWKILGADIFKLANIPCFFLKRDSPKFCNMKLFYLKCHLNFRETIYIKSI